MRISFCLLLTALLSTANFFFPALGLVFNK